MKTHSLLVSFVILTSTCLFIIGCGGGHELPDAGDAGDAGYPDGGEAPDLSERLDAGQVRAGFVAKQADLIGGMTAHGRIGDLKIYNSKISIIIEGARPSDGWGIYGGTIGDADIIRPAGDRGQSLFGEYFFGFGLRVQNPTLAEVINNGLDGKPAVVRFTGPDADMPFLDSAFQYISKPVFLNTIITVDYILEPDSELLEMKASFPWTDTGLKTLNGNAQVFIMSYGLQPFQAGPGFNEKNQQGDYNLYIAAGDAVSYGFFDRDSVLHQTYPSMNMFSTPDQAVSKGNTVTFTRYFIVASGGVDPVQKVYDSFKKTTGLAEIKGRITEADGTPAPGARVHVLGGSAPDAGYIDQAVADSNGDYSLQLPAGAVRLVPFVDGAPVPEGVIVNAASGSQIVRNLALPVATYIEATVKSPAGPVMPGRVYFERDGGRDVPPPPFGELVWQRDYQWVMNHVNGKIKTRVPPGEYTITACHGFEYTADIQKVSVGEGRTGNFEAKLTRVVDTPNYLSSDFHIHSMFSPDGEVNLNDLVATVAAEGVEAPVSTDHDYISDWLPTAQKMGVTQYTRPITGSEITTYEYGHFNSWPLVPDPEAQNNGAFSWLYKWAPQLFPEVLAYPTKPLLIVNHPRSWGTGGYFSAVGYDRTTGTVQVPSNWSEDFDAIEIINSEALDVAVSQTLPDWYSFLNRGKKFTGTSGGDVHHIQGMIGLVRNYVYSSTDDPSKLDPNELANNVRAMKVLVTTGPFINVSVKGMGMGQTISQRTGPINLYVKIQAPLWMKVKRMSIIGNGMTEQTIQLTDETKVVRFDGFIPLNPVIDTWYVVLVEGDEATLPITDLRPFAFTNPIFIDRDGSGRFDPPM